MNGFRSILARRVERFIWGGGVLWILTERDLGVWLGFLVASGVAVWPRVLG